MNLDAEIVGSLAATAPVSAAGLALQAIWRRAGFTGEVNLADVRRAMELGGMPSDASFEWIGASREDTPPPVEKQE